MKFELKVLEAENLLVGFVEENGGRVLINNLGSSGASFIPKGLIHFEMNLGCKAATYLSSYNNVDSGVVTISDRGFNLPIEVLESTYYLSEEQIESIQKYLPNSPAGGVLNFGFDECIARCQKPKPIPRPATTTRPTTTRPAATVVYERESYESETYEAKPKRPQPVRGGLGLGLNIENSFESNSFESNSFESESNMGKHKYPAKKSGLGIDVNIGFGGNGFESESFETESFESKPYKTQKFASSGSSGEAKFGKKYSTSSFEESSFDSDSEFDGESNGRYTVKNQNNNNFNNNKNHGSNGLSLGLGGY